MMKQTILTGWNFMRWLRLGFGFFFAVEALRTGDKLTGIAAVFFLFTALFNTGCCGSACSVPYKKTQKKK